MSANFVYNMLSGVVRHKLGPAALAIVSNLIAGVRRHTCWPYIVLLFCTYYYIVINIFSLRIFIDTSRNTHSRTHTHTHPHRETTMLPGLCHDHEHHKNKLSYFLGFSIVWFLVWMCKCAFAPAKGHLTVAAVGSFMIVCVRCIIFFLCPALLFYCPVRVDLPYGKLWGGWEASELSSPFNYFPSPLNKGRGMCDST